MTSGALFQVIDINAPKVRPTFSSDPTAVVRFGKFVLFSADDGKSGHETWISDGTTQGTRLLKDLGPGIEDFRTHAYAAAGDKLIFDAYTPSTGIELFVTDGTPKGTKLLKDIRKGQLSSYPGAMASIGGKVYFSTRTQGLGTETVVTDGTPAGTKTMDIYPGTGSGFGFFKVSPYPRATLGSQVFLRGQHPDFGQEVFTIDNGATTEPMGSPYGSTWIHGSDPILDKSATITGGTGLSNAVHLTIMGTLSARPLRLGNSGFLHFDPLRYFYVATVTQGPKIQLSYPIPNKPALKGLQVVFQTLAFDSKNFTSTLELSNGLHWAVGK